MGRSIMKKLLPLEERSRQDFMIYYIAFKMQSIGKTFEQIFTLMDTGRNNKIELNELASVIQKRLGILFAVEECTEVLEHLDIDSSGNVDYYEFRSKISQLLQKKYRKNAWMCTKADLLHVISEEYFNKQRLDFEAI